MNLDDYRQNPHEMAQPHPRGSWACPNSEAYGEATQSVSLSRKRDDSGKQSRMTFTRSVPELCATIQDAFTLPCTPAVATPRPRAPCGLYSTNRAEGGDSASHSYTTAKPPHHSPPVIGLDPASALTDERQHPIAGLSDRHSVNMSAMHVSVPAQKFPYGA